MTERKPIEVLDAIIDRIQSLTVAHDASIGTRSVGALHLNGWCQINNMTCDQIADMLAEDKWNLNQRASHSAIKEMWRAIDYLPGWEVECSILYTGIIAFKMHTPQQIALWKRDSIFTGR